MANYTQLEFIFDNDIEEFTRPKNDNQKLLNLQADYKRGSKRALDQMYKLGAEVAMKFINKEAKKNKFVAALNEEDKEEKAHNAIVYIIVRYEKKPDFIIKKSFTGYLFLRVLHELYYVRKIDKKIDYVDYL